MPELLTVEEARRMKGVSQSEMASLLNISLNAYRSKEKGETKFYYDEAVKFSERIGIPMSKIIFYSESSKKMEH